MTDINWSLIDDYEFVYLTADLLKKMGFVDTAIQGSGPDGGLDLLATELVPFAIQGQQPFRWGIQCKFSVGGISKSVNDQEIRDVTGILASDRYSSQDLRGYLVVTNRKIAQNVIERLRGLNKTTPYRTAFLDGHQLLHRLNDHSDLVEKYFGESKQMVRALGKPLVESVIRDSRYELEVEIRAGHAASSIRVPAMLDTGAEMSVIPQKLIDLLNIPGYIAIRVQYKAGSPRFQRAVFAEIRVQDCNWITDRFLVLETEVALLGRTFLQHFNVLIDSRKSIMKLWPK